MLRKTILSQSLLIAFSAVSLSLAVAPAAHAQSTTVGSVSGEVAGHAGSQVIVENPATGLKRTVVVDASGKFSVTALPAGHYKATLVKNGTAVSTVELDVLAGRGSEAVFELAGAQQLETVRVVGRMRTIDTTTATSASIFTAKQLDVLPIATKDMNGIIALAANTVKADARYDGGVSIGGGGPSENAYYINGFPVTNPLTQLGAMELPFGAIQQFQVQTGGFGAEFGRSVGGVVNVITKSGTNEWHGGVQVSVEPESLRAKAKNYMYPTTGSADTTTTDGTVRFYREGNKRGEVTTSGYIGGPIIQDKLFMFLAVDQINEDIKAVNASPQGAARTTGWLETENKNTRYLGKFDWNLTDDHRLELTLLGDNYKTTNDYFGYDYATHSRLTKTYTENAKNVGGITPGVGGDAQIVKYTGNLTNDLTISALYGQSQFKHSASYSVDASAPEISRTVTNLPPSLGYTAPLPLTSNPVAASTYNVAPGAKEETKSFRFDLEYKLGNHLLRAGLDENRLKSINAGDTLTGLGGSIWVFARGKASTTTFPDGLPRGDTLGLYGGQTKTLNQANALLEGGYYYYAYNQLFETTTNAQSNQSAQYLEDQWKATKNLMLTLGLRNETFENKNGDGETFLKMKSFISPRFAASWDVVGDSSLKVFGTAGRYSLQIPTHVAVRGASRSLFTRQYYAYTGIDPVTGAPTGVTSLGTAYSSNNEYNQAKNPKSVAAENMKPTYQDEITFGFEKALVANLTAGAKVTYRKLGATIDDFCDYRPVNKAMGSSETDTSWYTTEFSPFGCATINAGEGNTLYFDKKGDGNLTKVYLSAQDLGLPKPKRTYLALDFFLEHPFSNGWYGKVTYTYSKSKGNTEGQTKSDNAQQDVSVTSTWDTPELMENSYGLLPNSRTHQLKAYGYYQATPEWGVSGNLLVESGRPKNCFGFYKYNTGNELDNGNLDYGNVYFYCQDPVTGDQFATPRGSQGRLPWSYSLDLGVTYKPSYAKGLTLRVDVFNAFNKQTARVVDETQVLNSGAYSPTYNGVLSYTEPRKVALTASYEF